MRLKLFILKDREDLNFYNISLEDQYIYIYIEYFNYKFTFV